MRSSFFGEIERRAREREDIIVLTGDLGFKLFDSFRARFPDRFYDVGVAEANLVTLGAGLAFAGKNVYCYSIIPFLVMRAFEQMRIDIAYNNLPVKVVGVGCGFTYGLEGFTHFALEDLALMRLLPNMSIVVPADPWEAREVAAASVDYPGPLYVRLGKSGEPSLPRRDTSFRIGVPSILEEGKEVAVLAIGNMVSIALEAAAALRPMGIHPTLVNLHTLKPLDADVVGQILVSHDLVVTLEEHYRDGGLGSTLCELAADRGYRGRLLRIGADPAARWVVGDADYQRAHRGMSVPGIVEQILTALGGRS